jgi:hypothetical protein
MPESQLTLDIETLVDRARSLWREALSRETTARVELFAKVSFRSKVARDLERAGATLDHAYESGLAVRVLRAGHDHGGFAAASGLSAEVVRWALDTAGTFGAQAPASAPGPSDAVPAERRDLDAETELPTEDSLTAALLSRPSLEWVEAGTTVEVLIGAEGWLAARRRHRVWALGGGAGAGLVAQRGFAGWERLLDGAGADDSFGAHSGSGNLGVLVLAPDAASAVVAALVERFHGTGSAHSTRSGHGWDVADEPIRPEGLAGGSFDDAGFPAVSRVLASDGLWVDRLCGPGTFRRASFREPPTESATNLFMASGETNSIPDAAMVARRCRILRPSSELWVLELDLEDGTRPGGFERRWVRVQPQALLEACASRLGGPKVTPTGPIVPGLLFEGLAATVGKKALS